MGSDSGSIPDRNPGRWGGYNEHLELEMMVKAGLTPMQALVAATGTAARVMKIDGAGTLQTGKWADLRRAQRQPADRHQEHAADSTRCISADAK